MNNKIKLVIYDWDGTLMDSVGLITKSILLAFKELGLQEISEEKAKSIIGLGLYEALKVLAPDSPTETHDLLLETYRKHFSEAAETGMILFSGVKTAVQEHHKNGLQMAVATGKSRRGLDLDFIRSGIGSYFQTTRTVDECRAKPDPHMIEDILQELDIKPENAVMVGDTTFDMQMAQTAGVRKIAAAYGAHPLQDLLKYNPEGVFGNFQDLNNWLVENTQDRQDAYSSSNDILLS
ncbi:MAG: HAD-IA family hydrolase [Spirochaetia bacterium]|nr:HAD-IA family hydrolase [Spirochaetia bacterium]